MVEISAVNASEKRYRRNFLVLLIDWISYGSAMSFVSLTTVLPAFVMSLTDSKIALGLLSTISTLGFNFFQLISAGRIERKKFKKPFILKVTPGERIPWLIVAVSTLLLAAEEPFVVLLTLYLAYVVITISSGLCTTAWLDIVAKVIPENRRGFFFSTANLMSSIFGLASGILIAFYMDSFSYPLNFFMCFLTAFVLVTISWIDITFIDEPPSNLSEGSNGFEEYSSKLFRIIRNDKNYMLFTISGIIGSFGGIASSFYTAYAIEVFKAEGFEVGLFTSAFVGTQIFTNVIWGLVQDRYGHKTVLLMGGMAGTLATFVAISANSVWHFLLVFALTGASFSSFMVSNFPLLMEMAPEEERPTYIGLNSALKAPFLAIAPIIGGFLIERYGYYPTFVVSTTFATLSVITLAKVKQKPRVRIGISLREKFIKHL